MLEKLSITGFKSIARLEAFELSKINVLIGGNGAGKSNLIEFFKMLRAMMGLRLAEFREFKPSLEIFLENKGGISNFLYGGLPPANEISGEMFFNNKDNGYRFSIVPTADGSYRIGGEDFYYAWSRHLPNWLPDYSSGIKKESCLPMRCADAKERGVTAREEYIYSAICAWQIYQFHDTSQFAGARMPSLTASGDSLRFDGGNLAAFLYALKTGGLQGICADDCKAAYSGIVDAIRAAAPYFEDFVLEPYKEGSDEKIRLQWQQKGMLMKLQPHHISDGTLRFMCIATVMLQPTPPQLIIIDEPELGLHPEALEILAEMIHRRQDQTQFILATQSPAFADFFEPEEVITVLRKEGKSVFARQSTEALGKWLDEYSVGQLWRKNVIRGGITNG